MTKYIELDKVIRSVCEDCNRVFPDEPCEPQDCSLLEALKAIPAADARPVVRGFNVDKDYPSLFECSVCGWSDDDTTTGDTQTYSFCPHCGAYIEYYIDCDPKEDDDGRV